MSRGMLLMFKATLKLLRWQNRQQKGIKPRFRFGSVLLKNRGFGTDFDNRNNTNRKSNFSPVVCTAVVEVWIRIQQMAAHLHKLTTLQTLYH